MLPCILDLTISKGALTLDFLKFKLLEMLKIKNKNLLKTEIPPALAPANTFTKNSGILG